LTPDCGHTIGGASGVADNAPLTCRYYTDKLPMNLFMPWLSALAASLQMKASGLRRYVWQ
jgi:hypothetical protein